MLIRQAFFHGRIHAGREAEFRSFVEMRLAPMWRTFPGLQDLRIQFELERDEGAAAIPLTLSMAFKDHEALDRALAAPVRMESRAVTGELLEMFDGRIEHHVFDVAA